MSEFKFEVVLKEYFTPGKPDHAERIIARLWFQRAAEVMAFQYNKEAVDGQLYVVRPIPE